jgi:hypothetical protein
MNNPGDQRGLGKFERAGFIWGIEQLVGEE